jgi:uncharacterized membrane-anchored protein
MNTLITSTLTHWLNKVPAVTLSFWVIKIMCTTVGETGADYLAVNAGLGQNVTLADLLDWIHPDACPRRLAR